MRSIRLADDFDAVLLHDAVDYMTTVDDLRQALTTAWVHCRPGGVAVAIPDHTLETWEPDHDADGHDGPDGRAVRYLEWTWDPDPSDTSVTTEYAFVLREPDGSVRSVHESHRTGLFARATWLDLLSEVGFEPELVVEITTEDRTPRDCFVARRPG